MLNKALAVLAVIGFIGAPVFLFGVISAISLVSSITGTPVSAFMVDPNGLSRRDTSSPTAPLVTANPEEHGPELALASLGMGLGAVLWGCSRMLWQVRRSVERSLRGLEAIASMLALGVMAMLAATFPDARILLYLIPMAAAILILAFPFIQYMMGQGKEKNLTQRRKEAKAQRK